MFKKYVSKEWVVKAASLEDDVDPPAWRCYSCGSTERFHTTKHWSDYGYEYDVECNECGSDLTALDGEGSPECENCGRIDWFCANCSKCMCSECWSWFDVDEEPEEYICSECE